MTRVVSLFSGIAGLDVGLESAGCEVIHMCESWEPAQRVLRHRFPTVPLAGDVATFTPTSQYEVLAAGFPCTDLSHAGTKSGIFGPQSGLVDHVFRIARQTRPNWVVLENVPNLLLLHAGAGIASVVDRLEQLGYQWAYRTVDSRFTGVPQRRNRVIIVASLADDPTARLMTEPDATASSTNGSTGHDVGYDDRDATVRLGEPSDEKRQPMPTGFYWTEGRNGLGLVAGAVPTLKGGSTLGTPSAPAIWFPQAARGRRFVLPTIEDAEELQGLPRGWTAPAVVNGERDMRWKLVGNAVTTGVGLWIGQVLTMSSPALGQPTFGQILTRGTRWPRAAAGGPGRLAVAVEVSDRPLNVPMKPLAEVVDPTTAPPLSHRATKGFLSRVDEKNRRIDATWYADLEDHLSATRPRPTPTDETGLWASSPQSRARMQKQKQKDTKPELAMRRELTALGLRYQLQKRPLAELRSRLDIVFKGPKVAVDIRGCFWHGCPDHGTSPKLNADRWSDKLKRNKERDDATVQTLEEHGWIVIVVWEHDDPVEKAKDVAVIVEHRKPRPRLSRTPRPVRVQAERADRTEDLRP